MEKVSNRENTAVILATLAGRSRGDRRMELKMSGQLERSLNVLGYLVAHPEGSSLSALATALNLPLSATHRMLIELVRLGYVRQEQSHGEYVLTIKLVAMGLSFLSASGITDVAQPLLDRLAADSGELVRLAVVDSDELIFIAKAQGARHGLRYDPDMGLSVQLSCSAAGHAWLSTQTDEEALQRVARQGFGQPEQFGPKAPTTVKAVLGFLKQARSRGFSMIVEVFAPAMVTIAGPAIRLSEQRMLTLGPLLMRAAEQIGEASSGSELFKRRA
jgi:IclR family transcriptional regulator, acetate operon repressor